MENFLRSVRFWVACVAILISFFQEGTSDSIGDDVQTSTFFSPMLNAKPGMVNNKYYFGIDFPQGHIAIKGVSAEIIDGKGRSVPLFEAYLHHWTIARYFQRRGSNISMANVDEASAKLDFRFSFKNGTCQGDFLSFGSGSETRRTHYDIPDPYGVEAGNPKTTPAGYEEKWMLNVHVIDTRGVEDRLACLECRCDMYNITSTSDGKPLPAGYKGGLSCCPDEKQCRLRKSFNGVTRFLCLKYVVKWETMRKSILPLKVFGFDVTVPKIDAMDTHLSCLGLTEYQVEGGKREGCVYNNKTRLVMPAGGYVIFGLGHQHVGGRGSAMYGEDGRVICESMPVYGEGKKTGNEKGYVVGMTTCLPKAGSVKVMEKEIVAMESNYSCSRLHTGVMGMFQIMVADKLPNEVN